MPFPSQRGDDADRGDIVVSWLVKLVIFLGVAGVLGFDALAVNIARFTLIDQGETAARAASDSWRVRHDIQLAYDSALRSATDADSGNSIDTQTFAVDPDGTVHLRIERRAVTLVVEKVPPLKSWAQITETVSARSTG